MKDTERAALERDIRSRQERGDIGGATDIALRGYGGEIWNFLVALHHRDEDGASDAFSLFAEGLWRSLPGFAWHCSFRTWAYAVAKKCSLRVLRDARVHDARNTTLPEGSALAVLVHEIKSQTVASTVQRRKSRLLALRAELPPEDQTLLMLRVDRELAWNDLAHVLHDDEALPLEGAALKREAARLRKRFQTVKEKLTARARSEGLARSK